MSKSYEATGKTREEAIDAGLEALGLTIGEVNVDVVEEGSKGLFGEFLTNAQGEDVVAGVRTPMPDRKSVV